MAVLEDNPDVLDNTYLIYTSDNGYHLGQHRLPPGKTCNIEEDINVPFVVRGPGVSKGKSVSFPTSHTDLAPTFLQLAGIPLRNDFDGAPIAITEDSQRQTKLPSEHVNIEYWGRGILEGTGFRDIRMYLYQYSFTGDHTNKLSQRASKQRIHTKLSALWQTRTSTCTLFGA
jgi:arylsulfatase A-like enzyme